MKRLLDRYRDTLLGFAPAMLVIAGLLAVQWKYDYLRTSLDKTVTGLEPATMYVLDHRRQPCIGEMVRYKSKANGLKYYRKIVAGTGAAFALTETGYLVDGTSHEMNSAWRDKASSEANSRNGDLSIPSGHMLVINQDFAGSSSYTNWAFEILPRKQIDATVTHILFSRDLSRIGERVQGSSAECTD